MAIRQANLNTPVIVPDETLRAAQITSIKILRSKFNASIPEIRESLEALGLYNEDYEKDRLNTRSSTGRAGKRTLKHTRNINGAVGKKTLPDDHEMWQS